MPQRAGRGEFPRCKSGACTLVEWAPEVLPEIHWMVGVDGSFTVIQKRVYELQLRIRTSGLLQAGNLGGTAGK
jgi:hypothetical protein